MPFFRKAVAAVWARLQWRESTPAGAHRSYKWSAFRLSSSQSVAASVSTWQLPNGRPSNTNLRMAFELQFHLLFGTGGSLNIAPFGSALRQISHPISPCYDYLHLSSFLKIW